MNSDVAFEPKSTAFLFMDFQMGIVRRLNEGADGLLQRTAMVLDAARAAGVFIAHVKIGFRPGHPEISDRNLSFAPVRQMGLFVIDSPEGAFHDAVAPRGNEPTVVKHRVGAFPNTDLDLLLRARGIDTLVLLGISTSGVVLSTLRHAADADYRIFVVKDGCADSDAETHEVLMGKVFPRQATVLTCEGVVAALRNSSGAE